MQEVSSTNVCPECNTPNTKVLKVEAGLKLLLQQIGTTPLPTEACYNCIQRLTKLASKGAILRAGEEAKEQARHQLWRNRISLVKQGKQLMSSKLYTDAAVSYEKYIRILEIVHSREAGELSPELFSTDARKQEITVITGVYWDLVKIYDTHELYLNRQMIAVKKLADFAPYSTVFASVVKRAEAQMKKARNPKAFKEFMKLANAKRNRCFIATAAFDGVRTSEVETLCRFRDEYLQDRAWGRGFVKTYYVISPPIANFLDLNPALKPFTRKALRAIAQKLTDFNGKS